MEWIFEPDIEGYDFIELVLKPDEYRELAKEPLAYEFDTGLYGDRPINICIRVEEERCHSVVEHSKRTYTPESPKWLRNLLSTPPSPLTLNCLSA